MAHNNPQNDPAHLYRLASLRHELAVLLELDRRENERSREGLNCRSLPEIRRRFESAEYREQRGLAQPTDFRQFWDLAPHIHDQIRHVLYVELGALLRRRQQGNRLVGGRGGGAAAVPAGARAATAVNAGGFGSAALPHAGAGPATAHPGGNTGSGAGNSGPLANAGGRESQPAPVPAMNRNVRLSSQQNAEEDEEMGDEGSEHDGDGRSDENMSM